MYSLKDIVNEYLAEQGYGENMFAKFYQLGLSGLREANMDTSGVPKVIELSINDNDTADLPNDFLAYSKIALCGDDGRLHSLGLDNSLCLNKQYDSCGNRIAHADTVTVNQIIENYDYLRAGELTGGLYGIGGGNNTNGYYRIDKSSNQILLSNVLTGYSSIVLEYIADVSAENNDFEVHPYLIETIKSWIYWKSIQRNAARGLGEKEQAKRDYFREERLARMRFGSNTIDEWYSAFRSGNKSAPKF